MVRKPFGDMKVVDLKAELRTRGLPVAGLKAALIKRLEEYEQNLESGSADSAETVENGDGEELHEGGFVKEGNERKMFEGGAGEAEPISGYVVDVAVGGKGVKLVDHALANEADCGAATTKIVAETGEFYDGGSPSVGCFF